MVDERLSHRTAQRERIFAWSRWVDVPVQLFSLEDSRVDYYWSNRPVVYSNVSMSVSPKGQSSSGKTRSVRDLRSERGSALTSLSKQAVERASFTNFGQPAITDCQCQSIPVPNLEHPVMIYISEVPSPIHPHRPTTTRYVGSGCCMCHSPAADAATRCWPDLTWPIKAVKPAGLQSADCAVGTAISLARVCWPRASRVARSLLAACPAPSVGRANGRL